MVVAITSHSRGAILKVHVQPGAKKSRIVGEHGDALKLSVAAPPEDGKANAAVLQLLSAVLGLKAAELEIISGQTSRQKRVLVFALTPQQLQAKLAALG